MFAPATTSNTIRGNLASLHQESLTVIATLAMIAGYVWLWIDIWPVTGTYAPASSWIGAGILSVGGLLSYQFRSWRTHLASYLLIVSLLLAVICAVLSFHFSAVIYLFTLPIIFSSVLLSQRGVILMAALIIVTILAIQPVLPSEARTGSLPPIGVIVCLTISSLLSVRNLHTTLAWFGEAYDSAYRSEQIAREHEGKLRRALKTVDDMAYRLERMNYTLTLERNQAEEARRLKQQFAQTISHELRTPLNIIISFTDLMAQSPEYYGIPLPPAYMRDLSVIHRNAQYLQALVNDVLDLARIEAAQMVVIPEETDPAALVRDAVQTVKSLVEMRRLKLNVQIKDRLPKLWVDITRIRQVLFNLLNNAVRFTQVGSITLKVERREDDLVFSVQDTGTGIAEEDIPRLFVEFHQINGGTRRQHGGAGLGLAISRRFVELHHGRIWVESQPGVGSTFSFSLPIMPQRTLQPDESVLQTAVDEPPPLSKAPRIVVAVTRSPSAAILLTRHLRNCRTVVVQSLEEAHLAIERLLPQGVVIDAAHEDVSLDTLEGLSRSWNLRGVPLIACPLPGEDLMRQQLAVNGYLVKPVSVQNIQDLMRQFDHGINVILVIDNNHDFILMLTRLLNTPLRPHTVIGAYNAQEGLSLAEHHHPDLIFLDLQLPDMHGIQLIEKIRALPALADTPIVVVSGEDKIDLAEVEHKPLVLIKQNGILPGETVRMIQSALDNPTAVTSG